MARSAQVGHAPAVRLLCDAVDSRKASPHAPDKLGWTPLHRAAHAGHLEAVNTLLQYLPVPRSQAKSGAGCTPGERNYAQSVVKSRGVGVPEGQVVTPLDVATDEGVKQALRAALADDGSSIKTRRE